MALRLCLLDLANEATKNLPRLRDVNSRRHQSESASALIAVRATVRQASAIVTARLE